MAHFFELSCCFSRTVALLLHHLHHDSHRSRDLTKQDSRHLSKSLGDSDLANVGLGLLLEPKAERCDVFLWYALFTIISSDVFVTKVFGNLFIATFNIDESVALEGSDLLEDHFVYLVADDEDGNV